MRGGPDYNLWLRRQIFVHFGGPLLLVLFMRMVNAEPLIAPETFVLPLLVFTMAAASANLNLPLRRWQITHRDIRFASGRTIALDRIEDLKASAHGLVITTPGFRRVHLEFIPDGPELKRKIEAARAYNLALKAASSRY